MNIIVSINILQYSILFVLQKKKKKIYELFQFVLLAYIRNCYDIELHKYFSIRNNVWVINLNVQLMKNTQLFYLVPTLNVF